jgi:hypothetical protein
MNAHLPLAKSLIILALPPPPRSSQDRRTGFRHHGDTIEIHGQRIRFFGVDAPEIARTCIDAKNMFYRGSQKAALAPLTGERTSASRGTSIVTSMSRPSANSPGST